MVIAPLDRKLLRELVRMRGQVLSIALIIASGIASYITMITAYRSLQRSRDAYYDSARFADVFASVRRAPGSVADRLRAIPGVAEVETRIVESVLLDLEDMPEPATARVVTVARGGDEALNRLHLRRGRWLERGRADEALVSEAFAHAHHLAPGDVLVAVFNGRRTRLRVAGIALSPEYIYTVPPGEMMPDDRRFGVLWVDAAAVESAFSMEGAFNDVTLSLARGAPERTVLAEVDRVLSPYGAFGAVSRERQMSARYVEQELTQLGSFAALMPAIFLSVAAFLVYVVLARMISTQREQLAALKALGYTNAEIAVHYAKFVVIVSMAGAGPGVAAGAWAGSAMTDLYGEYFRFPTLGFQLGAEPVVTAVLVSVAAGLAGAMLVIRRAVRLPPAEAMRPESPPRFEPTFLERIGAHRIFSHAARMVLRDMERRPWRTLFAVLGIAFAVAIVVAGRFSFDSVDYLVDVQFRHAQREDMTVAFTHPLAARARDDVAALPGVLRAEPSRSVAVHARHGRAARDLVITGLDGSSTLRRVVDQRLRAWAPPDGGLAISRVAGERLGVRRGDTLDIEPLEGDRRIRTVRVVALIDDFLGESAFMERSALGRMLGEGERITEVAILVDPRAEPALLRRVKQLPNVAGVTRRSGLLRYFRDEMARSTTVVSFALALFSSIIAVGVVYNSARIALASRARELASLRVLGFTRGEVAAVLLGEQMVQVLLAIVPGLFLGLGLASIVHRSIDQELFRFPMVILPRSYAFAAALVLGAGLGSAMLVRRRVNTLDMIAVLKARD